MALRPALSSGLPLSVVDLFAIYLIGQSGMILSRQLCSKSETGVAERDGHQVVAEHVVRGYSVKTADRPEFRAMTADAKARPPRGQRGSSNRKLQWAV